MTLVKMLAGLKESVFAKKARQIFFPTGKYLFLDGEDETGKNSIYRMK